LLPRCWSCLRALTVLSLPLVLSLVLGLSCGGICCAAELPAVREALGGCRGVGSYHVNVPLKQVNIGHDPDCISAQELLRRLASVGGTTILKDGSVVTVQSQFQCDAFGTKVSFGRVLRIRFRVENTGGNP
jgi:copper chaperone CopZ